MDFDKTFRAVSAGAELLATRLADIAAKGAPLLEVEVPGTPVRMLVRVFSSKADVDPDGVFGSILLPTAGRAWLKYELDAQLAARKNRGVRAAKLSASIKAVAGMGAYVPSPASATVAQVLHRQVIPLVLDADDMRRLAPGEAACATLAGTLSAKLQFNWADVLAGPITPLQGLVPGDMPVNLAVDFKAGLVATIGLSDSFRLVFSGVDEDYVAVSLDRASGDTLVVTAGATTTVHLEKPELARGMLADLAAQLLGVDAARIAALRGQLETVLFLADKAVERLRAELASLAGPLDAATPGLATLLGQHGRGGAMFGQLAEAIAEKIGGELDDVLAALQLPTFTKDALGAARGLLQRLERLEAALLEMAHTRIERGFDFEYRRIGSEASLLKARLRRSHPDFAAWHRSLLALDATGVLDATRAGNQDAILEIFLHQESIKRSVSLGMDLGWFHSDRDGAETRWSESTRISDGEGAAPTTARRLALMGSRSRDETALGTPSKCRGQFDAGFIATGPPGTAGRWSFALHLAYASSTRKADQRWLRALADYACVWGVTSESEMDWLVATLESDGAIGGKVAMEIAVTFDHAAFANAALFAAFGTVSDSELGLALATALQRMEEFKERATPASRAATYSDAVAVLLGHSGIDVTDAKQVARFVSRHLVGASRGLKDFEGRNGRPIPAGSVACLTQHTGSVLGVIRQFKEAGLLQKLAGGPCNGSEAERKLVADAFKGLDLAWRDRFLLRWQVALLRSLAARAGVSHASSSTLKVTIANHKVRIFAPRAAGHLLA